MSLTIEPGEVVGYIGPNGAGKSTTIKMLTGILVPTSGRVRVLDLDPQVHRVALARRIGVVFGHRTQLWWDLPLRDSFDLLRHVYRVPAQRHAENVATFVELLDLGALLDQLEKEMKRAPEQKQWAMNHCLAEIGIHHRKHRARAIGIGERLAVLIDYPASPGCTPPYAPLWIAEMVRRKEAAPASKKRSKAKKR